MKFKLSGFPSPDLKMMKKSNLDIGKKGEDLAIDYLRKKGYSIREKNFRYSRSEIDIIAEKDNILIFIEVKARQQLTYGQPEEAVDQKKIDNIIIAAEEYLYQVNWKNDIRFDIISILFVPKLQITHFKDAFSE